jgi:hypothetical protein
MAAHIPDVMAAFIPGVIAARTPFALSLSKCLSSAMGFDRLSPNGWGFNPNGWDFGTGQRGAVPC